MSNVLKYELFYEISAKLSQKLGSIPVLYGSLGLSRTLGVDIRSEDIDLLIEDKLFTNKLPEIYRVMDELGFTLLSARENEFERESIKVGIASDGDMLSFSGVNPSELAVQDCVARFRVLSAEQYLMTYKASSLDGYRRDAKQKDDQSKVELIKSVLNYNYGLKGNTKKYPESRLGNRHP